jgi:hypothetical protein
VGAEVNIPICPDKKFMVNKLPKIVPDIFIKKIQGFKNEIKLFVSSTTSQ